MRVRTGDGAEGYGQVSPYNADIAATCVHRMVAGHFLGHDVSDLEDRIDRCVEANYKFPGSYVRRALTGVETAIWDLRGKIEGKSVCELIGGKPNPVVAYGSSMSRSIKPQDEAERLAKLKESHGYRAFKIRVGSVNGHDRDAWPGRTEELVPTVRKAVGDDVALLVDGNSCYTPRKAIEVGKKILEPNNIGHFEEPCPYWEYEWTAQVTRAIRTPVAGGEQDCFLHDWRRMINMRAVDIVQPDVCYIGGLIRALRVAKMAEAVGMPVVPHSANLSMVTVFTVHMMAAIPNAGPHLEFSIEDNWAKDLYEPMLEVKNGVVDVPPGPGWGVTINPDWLAKAERRESLVG